MVENGPNVCIIGAGFSGICAAIQLEKQLGIKDYVIFDENDNFGGTWLVNTYPGSACDIQSYLYSFSFELNPDWSSAYSGQCEILQYLQKVAVKYDLYKNVRFQTQVNYLDWDSVENQWQVTLYDKKNKIRQKLFFDFVIIGVGTLRVPHIPDGFEKFQGIKSHSTKWDRVIDLTNKNVGVVGSGASAVQILPAISPICQNLYSYQRNPSWVIPKVDLQFPPNVKNILGKYTFLLVLLRWIYFLMNECMFFLLKSGILNKIGEIMSYLYLVWCTIGAVELRKNLIPKLKFGCKRILISAEYYPTFHQKNVHLIRNEIVKVDKNSITTSDGREQHIDVLLFATGFKTQTFFYPLKIKGLNKLDLMKDWSKNYPQTYYGIMCHQMPNAFFLYGPNTNLGHNSIVYMIECQCNFIMQIISEFVKKGSKSVKVEKSAQDQWMKKNQEDLKSTVWPTCQSWYTKDGHVTANYSKTCISYYWETRKVNFNHMQFT